MLSAGAYGGDRLARARKMRAYSACARAHELRGRVSRLEDLPSSRGPYVSAQLILLRAPRRIDRGLQRLERSHLTAEDSTGTRNGVLPPPHRIAERLPVFDTAGPSSRNWQFLYGDTCCKPEAEKIRAESAGRAEPASCPRASLRARIFKSSPGGRYPPPEAALAPTKTAACITTARVSVYGGRPAKQMMANRRPRRGRP